MPATRSMAKGSIKVKTYDAHPYDEPADGPRLVEIRVTETFSGDIDASGTVRFLQAVNADGSAAFSGIERVDGQVKGRRGTFLLQDEGTVSGQEVKGRWRVVPGSGTAELTGLRGEGEFVAKLGEGADWTLEHWFAT